MKENGDKLSIGTEMFIVGDSGKIELQVPDIIIDSKPLFISSDEIRQMVDEAIADFRAEVCKMVDEAIADFRRECAGKKRRR